MARSRTPSPVDELAERYQSARLQLSPIELTALGSTELQDEYDDLSPEGLDAGLRLARQTLDALARLSPRDEVDAVTVAALDERLGLQVAQHERGEQLWDVNGIDSGLHALRQVYELMPTDTPDQWSSIARRLHRLGPAIDGWFLSQHAGADRGLPPALRQVQLLAEQCTSWAASGGYFDQLAGRASRAGLGEPVLTEVVTGVTAAREAYAGAAQRLADELAARATRTDAIGEERYRLYSRTFLGAEVDLAETYRWGLAEVDRIEQEQQRLSARLRPGLDVTRTKDALDEDPRYQLHGTTALREWMQQRADEAVEALAGVHFDIDEQFSHIECRIADVTDGGIWYTPPSDDFSRPGRMWWSVPEGIESFGTWRELTTVYHEGVPGHHLQCSQAILRRETLNSWRRQGIWVSGHGEGWALYAEQLMLELGFLDDPGMHLGLLDSQALRAVRVVIDIGLHCGFAAPPEVGGGEWTFEKAHSYFVSHVSMDPGQTRFELMRYFGWPGQAPSYALGQRCWTALREEVRQLRGADFDLKDFHMRALDLGSVGLDVLRRAVLEQEAG